MPSGREKHVTSDPLIEVLRESLQFAPPRARLLVGYSGGMDSHVLLHGLRQLVNSMEGCALRAVHVNHGLHPQAGDWEAHCGLVCNHLGVPLEAIRVDVAGGNARGPEAAARQSRYHAFAGVLRGDEVLCLAHHLDDQAETFLLQLLRGAGPEGLSAMPDYAVFGSGGLLRPLLKATRSDIRRYAEQHGLRWVEDPSNRDLRFDRNYLRHEIFPRLFVRWPAATRTIARAARHQAAVARAALALGESARAGAQGANDETLDCASLAELEREVAALAIRAWLTRRGFPPPAEKFMERIFEEVIGAREDASPLVRWSGVEIRRYRGRLYALAPMARTDAGTVRPWNFRTPLDFAHGRLEATRVTGGGLDAARCAGGAVEVRFRRGGERCRPAGRSQSSPLKHWLHQHGIPPWERGRIPLIYVDAELAAAAGLWVCAGFEAGAGKPGWLLHWRPRGPAIPAAGV